MGKGKAKRNSKKPTSSFKERCKRALLKNIAGFGGEMEKDPSVAFEFDIDNKTIDRRVEAIAETRDMAVAIAKEAGILKDETKELRPPEYGDDSSVQHR